MSSFNDLHRLLGRCCRRGAPSGRPCCGGAPEGCRIADAAGPPWPPFLYDPNMKPLPPNMKPTLIHAFLAAGLVSVLAWAPVPARGQPGGAPAAPAERVPSPK